MEDGAECFTNIGKRSRTLTKEQWDMERKFRFSIKDSDFVQQKTAVEQLCLISKRCVPVPAKDKTVKEE